MGGREAFLDEEGTRARSWETARRVLQAAAVEAHGRPEAYVTQDRVMQRANMVDTEHFRTIAKYLEERGWIAQADADYGVFIVTASGIAEAIG
jgi:predicted transcriptional regulator